jgi:hypothetical protein
MCAAIGVGKKSCVSAYNVVLSLMVGESVLTTMEEIFLKALKSHDDDGDDSQDGWRRFDGKGKK